MDLVYLIRGMWFPKNTKDSHNFSKCNITLQFRRTVPGAPNVSWCRGYKDVHQAMILSWAPCFRAQCSVKALERRLGEEGNSG